MRLRFFLLMAALGLAGITHAPREAHAQAAAQAAANAPATQASDPNAWFARVNGVEIASATFDREAREAFRNKFYHGTPPEKELNSLLKSVGDRLIDQIVLGEEAKRRKIAPIATEVDGEIAKLERRFGANSNWLAQRELVLPTLRSHFEDASNIRQLEKSLRDVSLSEAEIRNFYEKNPAIFTEPAKNKVSIILIRVDPSSPWSEWEKANLAASGIKTELTNGADFAKLAKERSQDPSAKNGGDLGLLHEGQLAPAIETELANLKVGEIGGPVRVLEGISVFRLDERVPAKLHDFANVEPRARERYRQIKSDETWQKFIESLRAQAKIEIGPAFDALMKQSEAVAKQ